MASRTDLRLKALTALKGILGTAAFVAAAAFIWGGSEALLNRWCPPIATWRPDRLLESAYGRVVFYAALTLTVVLVAEAAAAGRRLLRRRKREAKRPPRGRSAAAAAAILATSAGWIVAGRGGQGVLDLAVTTLDLNETTPFIIFWAFFLILGVAAAFLLWKFMAGRKWWRAAGKYVRLVGAIGLVAVVAGRWAEDRLRPVPRGPNVVLLVWDAWRGDAFRDTLTPHLYEYAARNAIVYKRAWSPASWTSPSMGSIFTGQFVDTHVLRSGKRADVVSPTLAQIFREAGYETSAFVANRLLDRNSPLTDGFDDYTYWHWHPLLRRTGFYHTNWYGPAMRTLLHRPLGSHTSRRLTLMLGRYLARRHRRPYFLWVHYMDPHTPYSPPPGYYLPRDEKFTRKYHPKIKQRRFAYHRLYEAECTYVDDLLAPMVLPALARDNNTIVVITGDHGEEFWEHDTWDHGKSVYEPVVRVPLILSAPGEAPREVTAPVSQVGLGPTILKLAGLEIPPTMQGEVLPLSPSARADQPVFVGSAFTQPRLHRRREDAIIVWPYKLIVDHDDMSRPGKFFNLRRDPEEKEALAEDEVAVNLRARLQAWKTATKSRQYPDLQPLEAIGPADLRALGYIQ